MPTTPEFITVNLAITFPYKVFLDLDAHWRSQIKGTFGSLASDCAVADSTLTLLSPVTIPSGSMLYVGQEPMTVASDVVNSTSVPVSRGTTQTSSLGSNSIPSAVAADHPANATIQLIQFATPWVKLDKECFDPYTRGIVDQRGADSYTFQSSMTGTVVGTS